VGENYSFNDKNKATYDFEDKGGVTGFKKIIVDYYVETEPRRPSIIMIIAYFSIFGIFTLVVIVGSLIAAKVRTNTTNTVINLKTE